MKTHRVLVGAVLLASSSALLAGCPGDTDFPTSPAPPTSTPTATPTSTPPATPTPTPATMNVSVATDKASYKRGEPVKITITAQSIAPEQQEVTFPSGQSYDVLVYDQNDTLVWQWSRGKFFTMALRSQSVKPNEKISFSTTWNGKGFDAQNVPAGTYTLRAKITANGGISAPDATITVK